MRDHEQRDEAEILAGGAPGELAPAGASEGPSALLELLRQQQRDASAGRAQSREVVRALSELRDSQEYLGTTLRGERRFGRVVVAALILVPFLIAIGAWYVRDHLDRVRTGIEGEFTALEGRVDGVNERTLASARDEHREALEETIRRLEGELDRTRASLGSSETRVGEAEAALQREKDRLAAVERDWTDRFGALERKAGEIPGLRAQVDALRDRAGAEAARADGLERELRELRRRTAEAAPAPGPATDSGTGRALDDPAPASDASTEAPSAVAAADRAALVRGATRDKDELARITKGLNALLRLSPGAVRYTFASVGGVSGRELLDVRLEGRDEDDRVQRTIEAPFAKLTVKPGDSAVLLEFKDGELVRGDLRAPFFEGRYGLVLDADTARWKAAGLAFLTVE